MPAAIPGAAQRAGFRCWLLPLQDAVREARELFGHATPLGTAVIGNELMRGGEIDGSRRERSTAWRTGQRRPRSPQERRRHQAADADEEQVRTSVRREGHR